MRSPSEPDQHPRRRARRPDRPGSAACAIGLVPRIAQAIGILLLCTATLYGCAGAAVPPDSGDDAMTSGKLDPRIRRIAADDPDRVIGVLVRATGPIGADDRAALEAEGLDVGSIAGDIVSGRLRAGAAARLAKLPFVLHVEAADVLRPLRSAPHPDSRSSTR